MADIELAQTPEPRFRVGDMVHEYMGTSAGTRAHRTVADAHNTMAALGMTAKKTDPYPNINSKP
jgi:hypothetical protein